jgi:hypothetical protein
LTGSDISDETKKFIADKRKGAEMAIRKRLDRAVEDGERPLRRLLCHPRTF